MEKGREAVTPLNFLLSRIAALEKVEKAAAPGPWYFDCGNGQIESANKEEYRKPICDRVNVWDIGEMEGKAIPGANRSMELIAESRNALPSLLRALQILANHAWSIQISSSPLYAHSAALALVQAAKELGWEDLK